MKRTVSIFLSLFILLSSIGINVYADETAQPTEPPVSYVEQTEGTVPEEETTEVTLPEETEETTETTETEPPVIEIEEPAPVEEKEEEELPAVTEATETPVPEIIVEETPVPSEEPTIEVTEAPAESELPSETEGPLESPEPTLLPEETEDSDEEKEEELPLLSAAPLAVNEAPLLTATGTEGEAYAILTVDGDLIFFRDTETYTNGGTYSVTINDTVHAGTVYSNVENTGTSYYSAPWHSKTTSIKTVQVAKGFVIAPLSMAYWFADAENLTSFNAFGFDTSKVKSMCATFYHCTSLTSLDLSTFDTGNVTSMRNMFTSCASLSVLDLSSFDTSNVTDMNCMFLDSTSLTSINLNSFDTSNVEDMSSMFGGCSSLKRLDLSSFDTSNVNKMGALCMECSSLTSIDLGSFDTSKVSSMSWMFYGCSSLTSLDLSSFSTFSVTNMDSMFFNCSSLIYLDLSSFDTASVTGMGNMFSGCSLLTSLNLSNFNTSNVTSMYHMFYDCTSLKSLDISSFDTSGVTRMEGMFDNCWSLSSVVLGEEFTKWIENSYLGAPYYSWKNGSLVKTGQELYNAYPSNATEWAGIWRRVTPVTTITLNKSTLALETGKTSTLTATVSPSDASNKTLTWSSSNTKVATVDQNGKITAVGVGTATITAKAKDGSNVSASCKVTATLSKPVLVNAYNSANGADIRWKPMEGVEEYVIMKKTNGVWAEVVTVKASSLTKEGNNYKYIDVSIKGKEYYGKGYIYSVAVKDSKGNLLYDTLGLPLYRLAQPTILTVTKKSNTSVEVTWKKENCQGYELQYSSNNGDSWTKLPQTTNTSITLNNLNLSKYTYVFRLRIQKTNAARGTTWSQFSKWAKVGTNNTDEQESSTLTKPVLVNIFNSSDGADIRWKPQSGVSTYIIMRKESGTWKEVKTVNASELTKVGSNYKYIDTSVKSNYGKGYIYSVAVKDGNKLIYDTKGLAFYRLQPPAISSVTQLFADYAEVKWNQVDAHGYEIQYSSDKGDTWKSVKVTPGTTVSTGIGGLDIGTSYVFRMRAQKTNASRGTTWSQWSGWAKLELPAMNSYWYGSKRLVGYTDIGWFYVPESWIDNSETDNPAAITLQYVSPDSLYRMSVYSYTKEEWSAYGSDYGDPQLWLSLTAQQTAKEYADILDTEGYYDAVIKGHDAAYGRLTFTDNSALSNVIIKDEEETIHIFAFETLDEKSSKQMPYFIDTTLADYRTK